jgi:glycosyltransferase involved in cell wall biosynthesis
VPQIEKVEPIYPPKLLVRLIGATAARLATFIWIGIHNRHHIVGGLHLLLNGLAAILLAKLTGAIALYNCCGGPGECCGEGGEKRENRLFSKLHGPDPVVERFLLEAVSSADLVITRGNLAIHYFQEHAVSTQFYVVPGGIDGNIFSSIKSPPEYDLIIVGRIAPVKRMEIFLQVVNKVRTVRPNVKAVILGDGPSRKSLEAYAGELNLQDVVYFAGHQNNVASWLQRAKIFVLTSESEGLSQAMIQAMLCGLPAIVTHVGEAEELVENGVNGFLVPNMDVNFFVESIIHLLNDKVMLSNFGEAAHRSAQRCELHSLARKWDNILNGLV